MDKRMYPIRHSLSAALAHIEDARAMYPDGPIVAALDQMQDAVSQLSDLVQDLGEQQSALARHWTPRNLRK